MLTLRNAARTIKYFQHRPTAKKQGEKEKEKEGDDMKAKKCVECGDHVPAYQNFLCEKCWEIAFKEKIREDKK